MFQVTTETPRLYFWSVGQSRGFHARAVREGKGLRVRELLLKEVFLLESPLRNVTTVFFLIICGDKLDFPLRRSDHFQRKEEGWYGTREYVRGGGMGFHIERGPVRLQTPCMFSQTEEGREPSIF